VLLHRGKPRTMGFSFSSVLSDVTKVVAAPIVLPTEAALSVGQTIFQAARPAASAAAQLVGSTAGTALASTRGAVQAGFQPSPGAMAATAPTSSNLPIILGAGAAAVLLLVVLLRKPSGGGAPAPAPAS
jgi:hypothetical protein